MTAGIEGESRRGFVGNWVSDGGDSRSQRRRLIAVLRMAHRVLGMKRSRLGLGTLGAGTAVGALVGGIGIMIPQTAFAQVAIGNGTLANPACGLATSAVAQATAIGCGATATGTSGSVAIGYDADATGFYGIALGLNSRATGDGGMALGANTVAGHINAVALGVNASATSAGASALGTAAIASGSNSTAVGVASTASALFAFAGGRLAVASGARATALGFQANASGIDAFAQGSSAVASDQNAIAIGFQATASAINAINIGGRTVAGTGALAQSAIAIGTDVTASVADATAIGRQSVASAQFATAIGTSSRATGTSSAALGPNANASANFALALGNATVSSGIGSIAMGSGAQATALTATAIGNNANASALNAIAMGTSTVADSEDAVAIGNGSTATGGKAVSIGSGNIANGDGAVAIGDPNTATGDGAIASGKDNTATGNGSVAMGNTNMVGGGGQAISTPGTAAQGAVGIGYQNTVIGQGSVAIGNTSSALAAGAVAFGDTAVANNAGDVALGSGSVTAVAVGTPSATINGTTYNFVGSTPTSTVSVGAAGAERTITNVAAGRISDTSTDAINGSQLYATNQAVDSLGTTVNNINNGGGIKYFHANSTLPDSQALGTDSVAVGPNAVANNAGDVAIGLNSASGTTTAVAGATIGGTNYTFAGDTPAGAFSVGSAGAERQIQNVAAGQLSSASTDAVNGSQLFATNQQVTANTTDITNLGNTVNDIAGDTSTAYTDANGDGIRYVRTNDRTLPVTDSFAQGIGSSAVGYQATAAADNSLALGRGSQATIDGGVALGSGSISDRVLAPATGQIAAGPSNFIEYNTTDKTLLGAVSVGTDTSYRQITNVADGTNAQDAVTIRQLQGAIASVAVTSTKYFHANSIAGDSLAVGAESVAVGPTTVVNADNGIGIGNGAIVDQVAPGGTAIGQGAHVMLADGVAIGTESKAAGIQSVALGAGAESNHINSVAIGASSMTTVGAQASYTAFGLTAAQSSFGEVSFGSAGSERKLTNVAAGSADTDAVNVSQLRGLGTQITNHLGGNSVVNPDGTITGPTYNIQGGSYTTIYDGFTAVDNAISNINNGGGIKYFRANSTLADSAATGTDSVAIGPESLASGTDSLAAGHGAAATGQGAVALGEGAQANNANDVALGSGSATEAAVGTSGATIRGKHYDFAGAAPVGTVSVGDQGAERTVTNVAAGRISADSTDAVNGSQLHATNSAIEDLQGGIGNINNSAVFYDVNPDGTKKNSITLQGGDANAPVVISNVGKGVAPTDAVNVSQLNEGITQSKSYTDNRVSYAIDTANDYTDKIAETTLNEANDYTDQKFNQLNQQFDEVQDEARQAAAIGLAAAALRFDDRPGKVSVAMGGGLWRGEGAVAFGAGYTSENGRVRANLLGTTAGGHWGAGAGVSFTLN
ncbi:collagen-binding protein [Mesorhizobium sp. L-8-10]|uniref:YadA-like family protein n=1 Tax=Mesorhizobium sp. L-8-10 TaxID=2744523 RepID=UPI001928F9D7|nr:YadA-like family protein [Mesorhizobium sp. L-8-10]BCH35348.1 collagen-binding protein [Mesorhizobium sp. L-8-10]